MSDQVTRADHPYQDLTPDVVQDALASVGLWGDGRQLALSSYENRVYQLHLEDASVVVAKFYRPGRWSDAQILEEHAFAAELVAAEVPLVGPLELQGSTLNHFAGFAFSVSPSRGGRAPELDDDEVLAWIGRFLARLHNVGASAVFSQRPTLDLASFGQMPRDWLLSHDQVPLDVQSAWQKASQEALDLIAASAGSIWATEHHSIQELEPDETTGAALQLLRLHGDCHPGNILWTPLEAPASALPGPLLLILTTAAWGQRCKTCGCFRVATGRSVAVNWVA